MMIRVISDDADNIVYTTSKEKLTAEDYNKLIPVLEDNIQEHGQVRWYFEMENFDGWKPEAFWKDLKFDVKHLTDLEKIAIVGEKKWHDVMTQFIKPFTPADTRYFDISEKSKAKGWLEA